MTFQRTEVITKCVVANVPDVNITATAVLGGSVRANVVLRSVAERSDSFWPPTDDHKVLQF